MRRGAAAFGLHSRIIRVADGMTRAIPGRALRTNCAPPSLPDVATHHVEALPTTTTAAPVSTMLFRRVLQSVWVGGTRAMSRKAEC